MALPVPADLRVDALTRAEGIGSSIPTFSWRLATGSQGMRAYRIEVHEGSVSGTLVWDSQRIEATLPWGIKYDGATLVSATRYVWRVRLWGSGQRAGAASAWHPFSTGILDPSEWQACWISTPSELGAARYFRGTATLVKKVRRATAFASALGWYRLFVNGVDMTGTALVPRWTPLDQEVEYQSYEVTSSLRLGENTLSVVVADGRFRGTNGFGNTRAIYGDALATFVQIHVEYEDGSTDVIVSDESWVAGPGRICFADPKKGETADLRIPDDAWFGDSSVPADAERVGLIRHPRRLVSEQAGRVRQTATLPARMVERTPGGKQLIDFGQNAAGVVRIRLAGPAGTRVTLTHSEIRGRDGELDTDYIHALPVGHWTQSDHVTLDGVEQWWQPWFTIHGFRYVQVEGLSYDLSPADVECVVLSSELDEAGEFDCSDERLNQVHRNTRWSMRSNFTDTPTDCPTRERSGWTGDIQVFAPTASTFADVRAFLSRYLRSLAMEQNEDGSIPIVIPAERSAFSASEGDGVTLFKRMASSVGWGDAVVALPHTLHRYYGDESALAELYSSMLRWIDHLESRTVARTWKQRASARLHGRGRRLPSGVVSIGYDWGEWLRPGEGPVRTILTNLTFGRPEIATAYLAHSAQRVAQIATKLGNDIDAQRLRALSQTTREAYRAAFIRRNGRIGTDHQDDYVRAIAFGLLDEHEIAPAVERLVTKITEADTHIGTGFLSTSMLLPVLADHGHHELVWRLLLQTSAPSWLHPLEHGATTIWETWEGFDSKGRAKHSHNHYAFGSVCQFLTERVAGIAPAEAGYRVIDFRPLLCGPLTHAKASIQTPFGRAAISWRSSGESVEVAVTVPPGTVGRLDLGDRSCVDLDPGEHQRSAVWPSARRSITVITAPD